MAPEHRLQDNISTLVPLVLNRLCYNSINLLIGIKKGIFDDFFLKNLTYLKFIMVFPRLFNITLL